MNLDGLRPWAGLAGGSLESADVVVVGIPYDGSAVYRKGAALAPQRIRSLSAAMPPVTEDGKLLTGMHVHDMGDVDAGTDIESGWPKAAVQLSRVPSGALLTVLGGDHCTAIATLTAEAKRHPGLAVLWVDAHPALCDYSRGGRWTVGGALRRAIELGGLDPRSIVLAGCRDFDAEEVASVRAHGVTLITAAELAAEPAAAV